MRLLLLLLLVSSAMTYPSLDSMPAANPPIAVSQFTNCTYPITGAQHSPGEIWESFDGKFILACVPRIFNASIIEIRWCLTEGKERIPRGATKTISGVARTCDVPEDYVTWLTQGGFLKAKPDADQERHHDHNAQDDENSFPEVVHPSGGSKSNNCTYPITGAQHIPGQVWESFDGKFILTCASRPSKTSVITILACLMEENERIPVGKTKKIHGVVRACDVPSDYVTWLTQGGYLKAKPEGNHHHHNAQGDDNSLPEAVQESESSNCTYPITGAQNRPGQVWESFDGKFILSCVAHPQSAGIIIIRACLTEEKERILVGTTKTINGVVRACDVPSNYVTWLTQRGYLKGQQEGNQEYQGNPQAWPEVVKGHCKVDGKSYKHGETFLTGGSNAFRKRCIVEEGGSWRTEIIACRLPSSGDQELSVGAYIIWNCDQEQDGSVSFASRHFDSAGDYEEENDGTLQHHVIGF